MYMDLQEIHFKNIDLIVVLQFVYSCNLKSRIQHICEFWYINVNILTLKHF